MNWFQRLLAAIDREYERRVRRASLVTEYGAEQHSADDEDDDGVEIVNVPRGANVSQ